MKDEKDDREKILDDFFAASREQSTWTVLFHSVLAATAGLNGTDHKCLDILANHPGPMTAGQLAEITGLTTGAVTGVIDRLEKVGYVRRERDASDRRKVLVYPIPDRSAEDLGPMFDHLVEQVRPIMDQYGDEELKIILDYIRNSIQVMRDEIDWMREKAQQAEKHTA